MSDNSDYSKRELIGIIKNEFGEFKVYRPIVRDLWGIDVEDPLCFYKLSANCIDGVTFEELGNWPLENATELNDMLTSAMDALRSFK